MTGVLVSLVNLSEVDERVEEDIEETCTRSENVMCFPAELVLLVVDTSELIRGGGLERMIELSFTGLLLLL